MTQELIANSPTPGQAAPAATLAAPIITTPAPGTVETWTFNAAPVPAALQGSGQYHFTVDSEICIDITGGAGTSRQIVRGAEGSTPATHLQGAAVYHSLTAAGLANWIATNPTNLPSSVESRSSPTRFLSAYAAQQSIVETAITNVNQVASPSGLSIGNGGLIATTAGSSGTGFVSLPSTIDPTKPFRLSALLNITNPSDSNATTVSLAPPTGTANAAYYGCGIQISAGYITLFGAGVNFSYQAIPAQTGKYWFVVCGDGTNVHTCVIPYGRAGLYFGQSGQVGISAQAEVVAQRSAALTADSGAVNVFQSLSQITFAQSSTANAVIGYDFSLGYSGTALGSPAVFAPTIGAEASTPMVRLPGGYTGRGPLDIVLWDHANASDEKLGQRYNDPDAGAAAAYLLAQGYAVVSCRNGVDTSTYTSALSSPWGAPAGIAGRRALLQWCATNLPGARYVYGVGQSMGMLNALAMYRLYPGLLRAIAGISGVTNLSYAYNSEGFASVINTAYGTSAIAKIQDNDPNLRPQLYVPTPLKLWTGDATDTTVIPAQNSLLFKTNVEAAGGSVPVTTITGAGHLTTAALWDGPGLASFFTANQ